VCHAATFTDREITSVVLHCVVLYMDTVSKKGYYCNFSVQNDLEKDCVLTISTGAQTGLFTSCPIFGAVMDHHSMCFFAEPLHFYIIWLQLLLFTSNLKQFHQI